MLNETDEKLLADLKQKKAGLAPILADTQVVEDVLANNVKRTSRKGKVSVSAMPNMPVQAVADAMAAAQMTYSGQFAEYPESPYIPKNSSEHPAEYKKRLLLTPCFAETPNILQSRIGSMFKIPPTITLPKELTEGSDSFVNCATLKGQSLLDVINRTFDRSQVNGFCGVLVDRAEVPEELADRDLSAQERKDKKPGKPILALYTGWQILDWKGDKDGLCWVKLYETYEDKATWDLPAVKVECFRIVDRENITVFEVRTEEGKDPVIKALGSSPHSAPPDADGKPICPFFMCNPFPAEDGIGRSVLRGTAEADIAATRVLSDLVWLLHMTAPLLVLNSNREAKDVGDIGLGASRFNIIKAGGPDEREEISFKQIDCQPIDRLSVHYDKLTAKAREQADRMNLGAITGAGEVSGVSKAWSFKTAEERILFLFGHHMQAMFQKLLELVCRMEGLPDEQVTIKFPESYDIQGPTDILAQSERFLTIMKMYNQKKASALQMHKLIASLLPNITEEDQSIIDEQIESEIENTADLRLLDAIGQPDPNAQGMGKTGFDTYKKKSDIKHSNTDKGSDDEGEEKTDRSAGDKEDYEGNRK